MGDVEGDLYAVAISDHVIVKDHTAHARELYAPGLHEAAAAVFESFGAHGDFLTYRELAFVNKTTAGEVPMWAQHGGVLLMGGDRMRAVEIACQKEAGRAFKDDFFDGVVVEAQASVHDGFEWGSSRRRPEPERDAQDGAHAFSTLVPVFL